MQRIEEIPLKLQTYVEEEILPRYDIFDPAHRRDHVCQVIQESLRFASLYKADMSMCYVVAAYHDLGLCEGREYHHIVSGRILMADSFLADFFSPEQMLLMKEAIEDHRASNKTMPRSMYGMIVAEADRVIDPQLTLWRTVQYGLKNYPEMDLEQQYVRFRTHLVEKYAPGGYLRLWIPESENAVRLEELRKIIQDESRLRACFESLVRDSGR